MRGIDCRVAPTFLALFPSSSLSSVHSGVPITEDGSIGSKLVGLCTKRDLDLVDERHESLSEHMTPVDQLVLGREGCSLEEAQEIIKVSKKGEWVWAMYRPCLCLFVYVWWWSCV